jgi:hypothetical protein
LPPLQRWDLDDILCLIERQKYFLLHAPRQTGKTSCLLALAEHLNREGRYRAVRVRRIIEPMLAGEVLEQLPLEDLTDLGLLRQRGGGGVEIANPIYREVLPRILAMVPQASLPPGWDSTAAGW